MISVPSTAIRRWRAWILAEPATGTPDAADIQLSALRVVLLACLVLACIVGVHSVVMALLLGRPWAVLIVVGVVVLLGAAILRAQRDSPAGALLLLLAVYATGLGITVSTGSQPELSRLGYVISYMTPLVAGLLLNWRLALGLMLLNCLCFALAISGYQAPQLPQQQVRLPYSLVYVHATLFMFFNLCLPLAVFRMVAGMRQTQDRLRSSRELSEQVFQAASAPTLVCGPGDEVLRANRPLLALCGLSEEQMRGRALASLFAAPAGEVPRAWRSEPGLRWRLVVGDRPAEDACEVQMRSVRDISRSLRAYSFEDVTELRRAQADLAASMRREAWATWYDTLTGLPNRARCIQQLDGLCGEGTGATAHALLTLRISNLRQLNARYGVPAGDELLQSFVRRLLALLPAGAAAARVRGSVIAVLLPGGDGDEARLLAAARQLRAALPVHAEAARQAVLLDLAFGLVSVRDLLARQPAADGAELLRCGELALDMAQDPRWREAADGLMLFNDDTARSVARGMAIEAELPQALERGQLHLLYQPKLRPDGCLLGFEALVRWSSPTLGEIPPVEFIPVAEACGLVGGITDWVISAACEQLSRWRQELGEVAVACHVAINLSAHDLERAGLFDLLMKLLVRHGVRPAQLELEVTESALARQPAQALQQLQRLHEAGFRIAIDDFGTGYSSLAKLVDLPIDVLKIDRSFLRQLPGDARRERVVRSMVSLAHSLKLQIVAEGVETGAQALFLQALGVQGVQGFLYGRPERPAHWHALITQGRLPAWAAGKPAPETMRA
jgi:diguanylate cyclase (GGDEF)-like protein